MPRQEALNVSQRTLPLLSLSGAGTLILLSAVLACSPAAGQQIKQNSVEIGALGQTTGDKTTAPYQTVYGPSSLSVIGTHHEQIFGGAFLGYAFATSRYLAIEARAGYIFGHQPTVNLSGGTELQIHGGLMANLPLSKKLALIARVAPGITSFADAALLYDNNNLRQYGRLTHFSLEESVGLKYPVNRSRAVQLDVTEVTAVEGDLSTPCNQCSVRLFLPSRVSPHFQLALSFTQSFGKTLNDTGSQQSTASSEHPRTSVTIGWAIQPQTHLEEENLSTDHGVALTVSHSLMPVLDVEGSLIALPGGDEMNYQDGGTETELLVGIKAGMRHERYGVFGKIRPGFSTFARTYNEKLALPIPKVRGWDFSGDFGAVLEVYPAGKHLLLRSDFGEVLTLFHAVAVPTAQKTLTQPAMTRASLLFVAGAGWRF